MILFSAVLSRWWYYKRTSNSCVWWCLIRTRTSGWCRWPCWKQGEGEDSRAIDTHSRAKEEYSLMLTLRQHKRLQIELRVVFWNSFFWMVVSYVATARGAYTQMENPERPHPLVSTYTVLSLFVFSCTTDILVEVCVAWSDFLKHQ